MCADLLAVTGDPAHIIREAGFDGTFPIWTTEIRTLLDGLVSDATRLTEDVCCVRVMNCRFILGSIRNVSASSWVRSLRSWIGSLGGDGAIRSFGDGDSLSWSHS